MTRETFLMLAHDQVQLAFDAALARREELVSEPLGYAVTLKVKDSDEFGALIQRSGDGFQAKVTTGTADQLHRLWEEALAASVLSLPQSVTADTMTELSLTWLILHEIEHIFLRHFQIIREPYIAEGNCAHVFGIAERGTPMPLPNLDLPTRDKKRAAQCLELQADHEAMDIVLNAFQKEIWPDLHERALAVVAVILLIEIADLKRQVKHETHPHASTRLFQLLWHLCELWIVPAKIAARARGDDTLDPEDFPSNEIIAAFRDKVCVPTFADTHALAALTGSKTISDDLGDVDAFFADVQIASTGDEDAFAQLQTQGARHLMDLFTLNATLLDALGHEGLP